MTSVRQPSCCKQHSNTRRILWQRSFVQQDQEQAGLAPQGFEEYKKNGASGSVMELIQQIIDDAKAVEAEAIRSDEDAQKAYEEFVKETNA